jgi:hypothetical protein
VPEEAQAREAAEAAAERRVSEVEASAAVRFLGDAKSSLGDAKSSLGDARSSLGDAQSSLGDDKSWLGGAESSLGDVQVLCEQMHTQHAALVLRERELRGAIDEAVKAATDEAQRATAAAARAAREALEAARVEAAEAAAEAVEAVTVPPLSCFPHAPPRRHLMCCGHPPPEQPEREWSGWAHTGGGEALAFKQPT